ncbi:MAG: winged helix-turn-helix domain-containing protein, partial [Candidatus Eremiobacteraeota bacterium]|nr:winged helix-turn-helix domain-containing protein [Candidatus Eremiobacteraeota bacterium]
MSVYEFGSYQLDSERLLLLEHGEPVPLGPKVVETLLALIEHPGDVLTKSALLDRIWPEGYVDEANLAQNVYVLRKALR